MPPEKRPPWERFERFLGDPTPEGCIEWTGAVDHGTGYGIFALKTFPTKTTTAHRFAYILAHGPVGEGVSIHHQCHNKLCVNVEHLEAKSQAQHVRDHAAERETCLHGHRWDEQVPLVRKGTRLCRICHRERQWRYWFRKKLRENTRVRYIKRRR